MNVCVCTMTSPCRKGLSGITTPNMKQYAKKHGYDFMVLEVEDAKWEFKKHEMFTQLFEIGYELIWYKDDDALITNLSVPIENFIDDEHDVFITKDFNEINGGSIIIKNTAMGQAFNMFVLRSSKNKKFDNEQNVYNFYEPLFMSFKILPQSTINSYRYDLYPECKDYVGKEGLGDFVEGKSFVLHIPALSLEKRIEILKNTPIIE